MKLESLHLRACLLAEIRAFFAARCVLEVDTPVLSPAGNTDPQITSFMTSYSGPGIANGQPLYLHTSPEFPMKRLLAAGSGDIYQIARVFRNGEAGRLHNPEFTLLEWYRIGFDHHRLMDEVEALITAILKDRLTLKTSERLTYAEAFQPVGLDPHRATVEDIRICLERQKIIIPPGMPRDDPDPWLNLLLNHCIEPWLGQERLTFLYDFPASQAALARLRPDDPPVGERFELYLNGIELANGFHELTDAVEQRRRFQRDNRIRQARSLPTMALDERFLAALAESLPDCAGVALGIDRLVMIAAGESSLQEVIPFTIDRA